MLIDAIKHNHKLAIAIMLKYLENELTNQDISEKCCIILSHAIKHENILVKTTLLSETYAKNFNEILMYAIFYPRNTFVIDALLQHPSYKPDFILEEILKHLHDPQFEPKHRTDILIYAIQNQKETLIKVMLKYLENNPRFGLNDFEYIMDTAMQHKNDFVIKAILKYLEKPKYQNVFSYSFYNYQVNIIKYAIKHKNEFVIQAMLKFLEKIKDLDGLENIFICAIRYNHEFLINKILEHPSYKPWNYKFNYLSSEAIKYKNTPFIKKMLDHPKIKPSQKSSETTASLKKIVEYAIEQNDNLLIEAVLQNSLTHPSLKKYLKHAIENKNKFTIQTVLEHPAFSPYSYEISNILIHAIKHKSALVIKTMLKHPKFKDIRDYKKIISNLISFIIEVVKNENLEFKTKNDIDKKTCSIFINSPILEPGEIKLVYDIEKDKPLEITILSDTLTFKYPPTKEESDENHEKIQELIITIITHPYIERVILHPEIQEKDNLKERIEFIHEKIWKNTEKKVLYPLIFEPIQNPLKKFMSKSPDVKKKTIILLDKSKKKKIIEYPQIFGKLCKYNSIFMNNILSNK